jgi:hypothetical protein
MAYILFIGYMRLSTHLVLRILSNPRIYIVVLLYKSLSNPNISIGLYRFPKKNTRYQIEIENTK